MAEMVCAGFMETRAADEEIQKICDEVKCQVEEKRNEAYAVFNAVQYKSQVLQGVNYVIKVHVGGCSYLDLRVWKKLTCHGGEAIVTGMEDHHDKDPIQPFQCDHTLFFCCSLSPSCCLMTCAKRKKMQ
uniref:Cystatin-B n=1 Tax=Astatotilapia calliptera TaxID=8154 RepID=A0A3P8RD30_ASTCA